VLLALMLSGDNPWKLTYFDFRCYAYFLKNSLNMLTFDHFSCNIRTISNIRFGSSSREMLSEERYQTIIDILAYKGSITVSELVERFEVSEMTIRRDLHVLERKGLLRRVHGGAISDRGRAFEPPFLSRSNDNTAEKRRIGKEAAKYINNGDSITLDVGTTTLEIAKHLADKQDLTIITPSFHIASLLADHPGIRLILTGGILRPGELSMVGHLAERVFQEFYIDKLFLGAGCVDFEAGLTEFNLEDTLVKKAMLRSAKEIILVADASKFNRVAFTAICPLDDISRIITDNSLDSQTIARLEEKDIEVVLA
jgi:DeoR/GlpR family transcriptional regulator of sugar metabolism